LFASVPAGQLVIPVQVLGELYNILVRKQRRSGTEAAARIEVWRDFAILADTTAAVMASAVSLATDHRLSIWDAVVIAAASDAGCRVLLSEDMQDGFTWSGVTIVNPFAATPHPLLADLTRA
jgi:predicted nucleic acid-binding protein